MIKNQDLSDGQPFSAYVLSTNQFLVDLLTNIKMQGYRFTTVTPTTHECVLSKMSAPGKNLRDIFGWNIPFSMDALCPMIKQLMIRADCTEQYRDLVRSRLRISSLGSDLFFHSSFPTVESDSVFFGPDTYRFARFIRQSLEKHVIPLHDISKPNQRPLRILDVGCGTGAGGIAAVRALPSDATFELNMNDVNPAALELALVNARVAKIPIKPVAGDFFKTVKEKFDLIISNPPFMKDDSARAYRDGGSQLGLDLSLRIFKKAFEHLAPGGTLLLYTGVAMTTQSDPFLAEISPLLANTKCSWTYEEIDPDIFGEELTRPAYVKACRIAAVGLVVSRP